MGPLLRSIRRTIQTNRYLQIGLILAITLALLGLNAWQQPQSQKSAQDSSSKLALPVQLQLNAPTTATVGSTIKVAVRIDTKGQAINTVTADFSYPAQILKPKAIQPENSFIKIWFDKDARDGNVLLTGALPSPGFSGQGQVAEVVFQVLPTTKEQDQAQLSFNPNAAVYENKTSRNILGGTHDAKISILK